MLPTEIRDGIASVGADRSSGATSLVLRGIELAKLVSHDREMLRAAVGALRDQQPAMAGFHTLAAIALAAADPRVALEMLAERLRRVPAAVVRIFLPTLRLRRPGTGPIRLVTCSRSAIVEHVIEALAAVEPVHVSCAESHPGGEGLALAESLARAGIAVDLYPDAAIGKSVVAAEAIVVGADAITSTAFINKVGTGGLAALGRIRGIPVFVLAGREKILPSDAFERLTPHEGDISATPSGPFLLRRSPSFERIPSSVVTAFVTDVGSLSPDEVERASLWDDFAEGTI